jgi:hypothetical protein
MTVVFRPANLDPVVLTEPEVFDNGERILNGRFAIRVHIAVAPGKLLLSPQHQRGHMDGSMQPLSYGVFAKEGLPLSLPVYEPGRGFVDTPGRLYPLLQQKMPGRGAGDR